MPTQSTYYGFIQARGEDPSRENLTEYLSAIPKEDWGAEFKSAVNETADFLLRRPVAALGNHAGGELFVGVTDARVLAGTPIGKDEFYRRLSQEGPVGDWYILDLSPLSFRTTPVTVGEGRKILVVEVRKAVVPALVMDKDRGPLWYERRGGSDHELTSYEAVEARRRFVRGELLLQLYREFENAVRAIPDFPPNSGPVAPRFFRLPRFVSCLQDGSITSVLNEDDRNFLLVSAVSATGPSGPGLLQAFLDEGERIDIDAGRQSPNTQLYYYVGNELRGARGCLRDQVVRFAEYLRTLGVPISV
jgi:hypothetical protein